MSSTAVIGLVGRIGAGKSTVARRFADLGAVVVDADRIAHEVLDEEEVSRAIASRFGPDAIDAEGRVRRRVVAQRVFGGAPEGPRALAWLEALVHPRVRLRIASALDEARRGRVRAVVLDVPLLVQGGWAAQCDVVVRVECPEEIRRRRLTARQWTDAERSARDAAWDRSYASATPPTENLKTVDTSGDLAYTFRQVDTIWFDLVD